jgi:predicted transcriptional regulator
MRETVLLSIKPEFADKILSEEKRYEYRRRPFRRANITRMLLYATSPVGRVVGECRVDGILSMPKRDLWHSTRAQSGVTWQRFSEYFGDCACCYAIRVSNPQRYPEPLTLREASGLSRAPQSFAYLSSQRNERRE